jgi:hypothetical protein
MFAFFCVCVVVYRSRPCDRADPPSKESYLLCVRFVILELILNVNRSQSLFCQGRIRRLRIRNKEIHRI